MSARDAAALEMIEQGLAQLGAGLSKLRASEDWVDQYTSPLGKRPHLEAVRRGDLVGRKIGHSVFVKRSELDAYIEKHRVRVKAPANDVGETEEQAFERALAFKAPARRARRAAR